MKTIIPDSRAYRRFQHLLPVHRMMLADPIRNRAFYAALRRIVKPGSRVLDIGAGTGIWAIVAARLGARRVVAIEKEGLLVPVIRTLAGEQGVTDRVKVLQGEARRAALKREFDVVVTETIGRQGFDEKIVPTLIDARRRFLRPGGTVIPRSISLLAAPVHCAAIGAPIPAGLPLRLSRLEGLLREFPTAPPDRAHSRAQAPARNLVSVDLLTVKRPPALHDLRATWRLRDSRRVNAIAVWVEAELAPGIRISTRTGTHWAPTLLPVGPFHRRKGELTVSISLPPKTSCWTTVFRDGAHEERRSHAPLFAYLAMSRGA